LFRSTGFTHCESSLWDKDFTLYRRPLPRSGLVQQAAEEFDRFTRKLLTYKQEVESGSRNKDHEEYYARFLQIRETPKRGLRVTFKEDEIQEHRKRYAGFFCILSNKVKDSMDALMFS